jgi:hypothetical protein
MLELRDFLTEVGVSWCLNYFVKFGFVTPRKILSMTEVDLDNLGLPDSGRREFQRGIARLKGLSDGGAESVA